MMNASLRMQAPGTGGRLQQVPINPSPSVGPLHMPGDEDIFEDPLLQEEQAIPTVPVVSAAPVSVVPVQQVDESVDDVFSEPIASIAPSPLSMSSSTAPLVQEEQAIPEVPVVSMVTLPVAQVRKVDEGVGGVVSEPVAPIVPAVSPPPMSVLSSAVPHKEGGPISTEAQVAATSKPVEIMQPSEPEVMVAPELKEVVVPAPEAKPLVLDPVMKKAGATLTGEAVPVAKAPMGTVKLPMSYADAVATEKRTKFRDALHWFARYIEYQWRKLDPSIKG